MKENVEKLNAAADLTNTLDVLEKFWTFSQKHRDIVFLPAATIKKILTESVEKVNTGTYPKPSLDRAFEVLEKLMKFAQKHGDSSILPTAAIKKILTESIGRFNHNTNLPHALEFLEKVMKFS